MRWLAEPGREVHAGSQKRSRLFVCQALAGRPGGVPRGRGLLWGSAGLERLSARVLHGAVKRDPHWEPEQPARHPGWG